jgi:hypothetical protein
MGKRRRLKRRQKQLSMAGGRMTPDWLLQVLLVLVGIIGGGALWYFISQKQYHHALWSGTAAAVILIVIIALFIRNEMIKTEIRANTPVYFGELVPGDEASPPLPKNASKSTITLMLGDDLRVLAAQSENHVFSKQGAPFLSIGIKNDAMRISASIVDSDNKNIVRIINNEFQANPERAFNPKQPDRHSLVVRDSKGVEVLNIRYLNPKAMRIVGRFQIPGFSEPVQILPDDGLRFPGGGGIAHLTLDVTASKGGVIGFK